MDKITPERFYGDALREMHAAEQHILGLIERFSDTQKAKEGVKPIVYACSRIKTPQSMMEKLKKKGVPQTGEAALQTVYDAVGVRAICAFAEDVYTLVNWLQTEPSIQILKQKDYYANPKPSGYRSYHVIMIIAEGDGAGMRAELQIRTIAMDFWSTLEHQLKYKKNVPHEALIRGELKRCADEIASADLSMQTIRDILHEME